MAKNRRKGRDDQGTEESRKRRRLSAPEDTNVEILPAKPQAVQHEISVQVLYSSLDKHELTCTGRAGEKEAYWKEEKAV